MVARFAGPHGVRGEFKLRSFTDAPADAVAYGPLRTRDGRVLTPTLVRKAKPGLLVVRAPEVGTREDCAAFTGAELCVPRAALPPAGEDEFYLEDLVGLRARTAEGVPAGRIKAVVNHGAGDVIELAEVPDRNGLVLIPFAREDVPTVDLEAGEVVVVLPEEADDAPPGQPEPR